MTNVMTTLDRTDYSSSEYNFIVTKKKEVDS